MNWGKYEDVVRVLIFKVSYNPPELLLPAYKIDIKLCISYEWDGLLLSLEYVLGKHLDTVYDTKNFSRYSR